MPGPLTPLVPLPPSELGVLGLPRSQAPPTTTTHYPPNKTKPVFTSPPRSLQPGTHRPSWAQTETRKNNPHTSHSANIPWESQYPLLGQRDFRRDRDYQYRRQSQDAVATRVIDRGWGGAWRESVSNWHGSIGSCSPVFWSYSGKNLKSTPSTFNNLPFRFLTFRYVCVCFSFSLSLCVLYHRRSYHSFLRGHKALLKPWSPNVTVTDYYQTHTLFILSCTLCYSRVSVRICSSHT